MANPEDNDTFRERNALVNCRGDMSRIHIAGVGYEAGLTGDFLRYGLRMRETLNLFSECERTVGIKRSGNDWKAKHSGSMNQLAFEGLPLTLRAFFVSGSKKTVTLSPYW